MKQTDPRHPSAQVSNGLESETAFEGFQPLTANYLYCPNQFFDICLKSNSRGMVRTVAYILRQTLGWLDDNGEPIHQTVKVSFNDLIQKAGVSRGSITDALRRAVAMGFLECQVQAEPDRRSQSGRSAEYALRWDHRDDYTKSIDNFQGFYGGEGHRTPVPNAFFDQVLPNETLAVTKVVGAVIRHTVGYQTQFGGRRQVSPLSCSYIQRYTMVKKRAAIVDAIRHAEQAGYICRVQSGVFTHERSNQSAATYSIRWHSKGSKQVTGSKRGPEHNQFKNVTRTSSKREPGDQFKKGTSTKKIPSKNISKQQDVVEVGLAIEKLIQAGFNSKTARSLVEKKGAEIVNRQLACMNARKPKNRLGMLRKAIEQDWYEPESLRTKKKQSAINKRLGEVTEKLQQEEARTNALKQDRIARRQRLLKEWGIASLDQRAGWIVAAAEREKSDSIRKIILKQNPRMESPHFKVLDAMAMHLGLPTVSATELPANGGSDISAVDEIRSPQKENMVTIE